MKNLIKTIVLIALAVSCVKETGTETIPEASRRYNLSFEEATKTDLSGTGNTRKVSWTAGDQIKYYTESNQSEQATASVSLDGEKAYIAIPRGRTDEFINAVYGSTQLKSSSSTESCIYISSSVKSIQRYTSFAEAHVCAAFSDDLENPALSFHNAVCVIKFTSAPDVHKVVFSGNGGEIINGGTNGDLKISYSAGALSVESAATGGNAINQTSVTINTNGEASDFYFGILPVSFSEGITIDCYDADGYYLVSKHIAGTLNTVAGSGAIKIFNLGKTEDWICNAPPQAVDLGLSVKWATYNLGATKPEEYGDYFAWGETSPKNEYRWANYLYGTSKNGPFSKYVLDSAFGTVDYNTVLDLEDDAAHAIWGEDWRIPSKEEVAELMNTSNCTWTWTIRNGIYGYKVTSRKSGFTNNSIFLPANGMCTGSAISDEGVIGNYWSSSLSANGTFYSISPFFSQSSKQIDNCYRYFGLGIRPVFGAVVPVSEITIPETLILTKSIKELETLHATILPENATYNNLTWLSSDTSIVTVDSGGLVTGIALGTATITVYSADGSKSAQCRVNVNQPIESITLDKGSLDIYVGDEPVALISSVLPEEHTDKVLNWTTSDPTVVTVDANGFVTGVSVGTATITAAASDGSGKKATCTVSAYDHVSTIFLNNTELTLYTGNTATLTATILPETVLDKSVVWSSDHESVATVDQSGKVTAEGTGNALIIATSVDGAKTASCEVTVLEHDYVNLGLPSGLKWATCNVGATKPEEFGERFAWGETEPKTNYYWYTYKWYEKFEYNHGIYDYTHSITKYCPSDQTNYWGGSGLPDNKTVLDPEDDAAHVNWGGSWRMPTAAEWTELLENCTWTEATQNGIYGRLVTGSNGNSIFLPAAGYRKEDRGYLYNKYGYYWSSSLGDDNPGHAYGILFYEKESRVYITNHLRYQGFSVRYVSD